MWRTKTAHEWGRNACVVLSNVPLETEACLNRFEFAYIVYSIEMHVHYKIRSFQSAAWVVLQIFFAFFLRYENEPNDVSKNWFDLEFSGGQQFCLVTIWKQSNACQIIDSLNK